MSVSPDGSKRMWVYLAAIVSSGTPYCSATEIAIAQALTIPLTVEPSLPMSLKNTSPSVAVHAGGGVALVRADLELVGQRGAGCR